jgi:hypothetical protein
MKFCGPQALGNRRQKPIVCPTCAGLGFDKLKLMIPALFGPLLFMLAAPFWEAKPPAEWTNQELAQLLGDSPWAQIVGSQAVAVPGPAIQVYLATAAPMQMAEQEGARRAQLQRKPGSQPPESPLAAEYRNWLEDNRGTQIVLAIRMDSNRGFAEEQDVRRMEDESVMRAGRRKIKMSGHFPPYPGDPYLRLAFPRQVELSDKTISFDLYLPGVPGPYRAAEFKLKDMVVRGKLEL